MMRRKVLIAGAGLAGISALGAWYGYRKWGRFSKDGRPADYAGSHASLADLPAAAFYDVCIVGSGPAGTFLCESLAKNGLNVLVLEAGQIRAIADADQRYFGLNGYRSTGGIDYALSSTHLMAPGGTSGIWNGRCPRLSPIDFSANAYTPKGAGWPITYADLEPYYARAERSLYVEGDPQQFTHCDRSTPMVKSRMPLPESAPIRSVLSRAGFNGEMTGVPPTATSPVDGGVLRLARDVLPAVARMPGVTLVLGAIAHRIVDDESGRVTAISVRDINGNERQIKAKAFVLAGGGAETARRLLLSKSERWPDGLGNRSGLVGRCFSDHTALKLQGIIEVPRPKKRIDGAYQQVRNFELYERFKQSGYGSVMLHSQLFPESDDGRSPRHVIRLNGEIELELSTQNRLGLSSDAAAVDPLGDPYAELSFSFSERDKAMIEKTRNTLYDIFQKMGVIESSITEQQERSWGHHHVGTVRMGSDPGNSVVDGDLRVHGLKNLYLSTSGTFVTSGAVNPTLTIVALTHRLADHLVAQLKSS